MNRLALLLVSTLVSLGAVAAPPARHAAPLPADSVYQLPVTLTDQKGRPSSWGQRRGRPQVVAMFYTSCKFTCPLIVDSGKGVQKQLTARERSRVSVLLISLDPERDSPVALDAVVRQRQLDTTLWTLARPAAKDVRAIAGLLGVRYRRLANGDFNHTSALVLLDADGRIVARTEKIGSVPDPEFVAAVKRAAKDG